MDDSAIQLRVRVIVVSTRAALRSLTQGDAQASDVVARGLALLAALDAGDEGRPSDDARQALADARAEVTALMSADGQPWRGRSINQP